MAETAIYTRRRKPWLLVLSGLVVFAALIALGTWQMQRLHWKENLLATISARLDAAPLPAAEVELKYGETGDIDYTPVVASGTFMHEAERHFFATWQGQSGYYVYTPLLLAEGGRVVFVNRGFVPFDQKDQKTRFQGQIEGIQTVLGLARNPLAGKPSMMVPDNDPDKNIFYWKDLRAMAILSDLDVDGGVLPFFIDADSRPNPGGLPIGGVTMITMPNNHLQYALTWYGLAAALAAILGVMLTRRNMP
ncbi:SURF1 family protein [Mesorhizobium sp. NBSH29]|uniref:SURF1 family protein n=1 Tax=Mesorhizobium sp. NBSH29 TaxID=2654249 RepID=UPI0018966FFF|nr:SURF1 family protein [Mesorhizobium sp. NBSH29]QPC87022.1 SURF1 family protein [Mesorhizobium sp. NBSH29]